MQHKNSWIRNLHFKLFVLCAVVLLGQGLFVRPAQAAAWDPHMSVVSWDVGRLDIFKVNHDDGSIWLKTFHNQWLPWTSLGNPGSPFFNVSAVSWEPNRLDIFGVTASSTPNVYTVWHKI